MQNSTDLEARFLSAKRALFDKVYGARLNPEQCRAVFSANGPLLVLAGAGSGKTTVLVNRIGFLIKYGNAYFSTRVPDGVCEELCAALEEAKGLSVEEISEILPDFIDAPCPPYAVLAITFTNKAAGEIRERLALTFGDREVTDAIWAGTFHSVCVRILRRYGDRLGYRDGFSIYDTDDKKRMIAACMKELEIDEKRLAPKRVANVISMAKDALKTPEEIVLQNDPTKKDILAIFRLYQKKLMENNAVDFDDIIEKTVELLMKDPEVLTYYQNKFRYVLVDEYQDTNYAQFVLTRLLSDGHRNIMVVGDDDQSIYRFRGATIENILNFDKTYPDATVIKLEQNYRSTETILSAANAVIQNNRDRHQKKLWCDKGAGDPITLFEAEEPADEGKYIISRVSAAVREGGAKYSDFAILYRVNELARSLETTFAKSGVPYRILGGLRFYDRKEIKDMTAYLSLMNSHSDNLRLKRVVNEPKRGIGTTTVEAIEAIAAEEGTSMYEVMRRAGNYTALAKSAKKLEDFVRFLEVTSSENSLPSALIEAVFEETGYHEMLVAEGFEGEGKIANVQELVAGAQEYEKRCADAGEEASLSDFLEEISLVSDIDKYDENADAVVMMTIHAAKGLEFPTVFLAGMEDGIFPAEQNFGDPDAMSEERRLAYVAITRAKKKLYITCSKNRQMYGRTAYNRLSRFIREEVPGDLLATDRPKRAPARSAPTYGAAHRPVSHNSYDAMREFRRAPEIHTEKKPAEKGYGIERLAPGCEVVHPMFGAGVILSARDLGGDILYEVDFGAQGKKKLMATFARLEKKG